MRARTVAEAILLATLALAEEPVPQAKAYSCWAAEVWSDDGHRRGVLDHNLTTTTASGYTCANDWLAKLMGLGCSGAFATAQGTATATTATTLTNSGASFPTAGQGLAGQWVAVGANSSGAGSTVYGRIVSNTGTALTVDQWYNGTSTTGAAGTTPNTTAQYIVLPGGPPAEWMAVTSASYSPATSDTVLNTELAANGFTRAVASWSHSAGTSTYVLAHTFTATGTQTINDYALFGAANVTAGGVMPFESAITSPTLILGDTIALTATITV